MSIYLWIILAYLLVLTGFNFYRAKRVKSQEDFMVAGRSLKTGVMVFTLICTWIGSGTFIAGAEFASKGMDPLRGWWEPLLFSSLLQPLSLTSLLLEVSSSMWPLTALFPVLLAR